MELLSLIVPCYNEGESLRPFMRELQRVLHGLEGIEAELIFVDDGSSDNTLSVLKELAAQHPHVGYLSFSRNFGKESAILAGLRQAGGDYAAG